MRDMMLFDRVQQGFFRSCCGATHKRKVSQQVYCLNQRINILFPSPYHPIYTFVWISPYLVEMKYPTPLSFKKPGLPSSFTEPSTLLQQHSPR